MPYKNKAKQREYQRLWKSKRRAAYLADKFCSECGSDEDLEIHHLNPKLKISHKIWSWSESRREKELQKCTVLCGECHKLKTSQQGLLRKVGPDGTAWCSVHQQFLPVERFWKNKARWNGYQGTCKECYETHFR